MGLPVGDLRKLGRLSFFELCQLTLFVLALPVVARLLKRKGFRKTEQMLARFSRTPLESPPLNRVESAARMVSIAARRGPYDAQRLEQAVTLWWMLGLMGIETSIRMGIYKNGDAVEAHAWVLFDDEIVLGELEQRADYKPLLDVNIERSK